MVVLAVMGSRCAERGKVQRSLPFHVDNQRAFELNQPADHLHIALRAGVVKGRHMVVSVYEPCAEPALEVKLKALELKVGCQSCRRWGRLATEVVLAVFPVDWFLKTRHDEHVKGRLLREW